MGWVEEVMEATAEAESPRSFMRWAALASISAVVKDQLFLDKFYYKLYPNVYVFLIARSGMRKGFPCLLAKTLVGLVDNTRVISGRNSIQAIIKDLSLAITRPKRPPLTKAHGFIVSGELSTTFVEDPNTLTILMDLHDGHYHSEGGWKNTLKGSGVESLKDVCVTLLGAINQTHFKEMVSRKDISGGFIARTIIVEEKKRALKNSLIRPPKNPFSLNLLLPRLLEISKLQGQFKYSDEGAAYYDDWYQKFEAEEKEDDTGTVNRIHDQILKVAMLLSLSRDSELILTKDDIEESMNLLGISMKATATLTKGSGSKSDFGPKIKLVLDELINSKDPVLRSWLLRKYWGEFTAPELDVIINTLHQAKAIFIKKAGKDETYRATDSLMKEYEAFKKGLK